MNFKENLVIIRHARSQYNVRLSEDMNCGITEWGEKQARTVGLFMKNHMQIAGHGFSFYTSPFLRCLQTSQIIASHLDCEFRVQEEWREYINHNRKDILVPKYPLDSILWDSYPEDGVTFSDEFNEEFMERIYCGYQSLSQRSVVVTHGLPALTLLKIASGSSTLNMPLWDHSIENCSITKIVKGRVIWHGRCLFTECDHDPFVTPRPYDHCELHKVVKI